MVGHARLSPSSSGRWFNCPGSISLSDRLPDHARNVSSTYADEGTAAHLLAARCLDEGKHPSDYVGEYVDIKAGKIGKQGDFLIDDDMASAVAVYTDYCEKILKVTSDVTVEQWLSLEHLDIPGLDGGTGDFVAYDPKTKIVEVVDLKFGRGVVVEPRNNTQALHYALAAAHAKHNEGVNAARLTIIQPRASHAGGAVRSWDADHIDLQRFEERLVEAAQAVLEPDAPLNAGEWCRFCSAAAVCPARHERAREIAHSDFEVMPDVELLSPAQLSKLLAEVDDLEDFAKRVRDYAHAEAMQGRTPPGWKLVASRAMRKWTADAAKVLTDTKYWTEPELKSPAQVEKLLTKAERKMIERLVTKVSSGTVLAPLEDARPDVGASEFTQVKQG